MKAYTLSPARLLLILRFCADKLATHAGASVNRAGDNCWHSVIAHSWDSIRCTSVGIKLVQFVQLYGNCIVLVAHKFPSS